MSQVVVISGHPELEKSYTNRVILDQLGKALNDVDIRRLDRLYPDFQIDVQREQQALLDAEVIVLQFPFYWYSVPALLKKWIDETLGYNFAYGPKGDKLRGKSLILSFTVGGPEEAYTPTGYNHFRIEELVKPLEQTAYLTGMNYQPPVYTHRMVYIPGVYNTQEAVEARAADQADRLIKQIGHLLYSPEQKIERFVKTWFGQFDLLPEDEQFFLSHLSDEINLVMPEGTFKGHAGFRDWYTQARATFKPGCDHQIEQVAIEQADVGFQVELRIRLLADTFEDSELKGESINLLVNEIWQLELEQDKVVIQDYRVEAVNSDAE